MSKLIPFISFWILGSSLIWIQTNGQFMWGFFKNNPLILSLFFGSTISFIMITATRYGFDALNGSLWSIKWVGFAVGIIINALFNYYLMDEGINTKTIFSLLLAILILAIQIWE